MFQWKMTVAYLKVLASLPLVRLWKYAKASGNSVPIWCGAEGYVPGLRAA